MLRTGIVSLSRPLGAARMVAPRFYSAVANKEYDVAVIGGGPGGYVAAIKAAQLGLNTVCIESRGKLGGTCLNVGCIPSKSLLNTTHMYHVAKNDFPKLGLKASDISYDLDALMKNKDKVVTGLTGGIEMLFKKNKVTYVKGKGRITAPSSLNVDLIDGGSEAIKAKHIIIATGSEPSPFPGLKVDQEKIIDSTGALALKTVPKKMVVIGGGVIGLELGSVWRRLGSEVTVVEFADAIGAGMDSAIAKSFQRSLTSQGIKFMTSTKVVGVDQSSGAQSVIVEPKAGGAQTKIEADVVLVSIGRRPYTDGLGLKEVGVALDDKGRVQVNDQFQTNVPGIYAIGDVIDGPMLAHKAEEEGVACVENIAGKHGHVNYEAIPSVVYTHPEVAQVGKTEEQLKAEGVAFRVGDFPFMANSRARANNDAVGNVKVLADAKTDRILGIHIIGPNAGELIAEAVLAVEYQASSEDVARTCHAHPTLSEALKEACMAAYDKPIHM
ncbi:dihydrolipoyl dehydrogenase 1, mitochondrial [Fonticula alba]|uniref:Dihydrolipoyl dehydrogenase n=1 Tax=Fonticula alba TaxID=691883 RepID=A0A058Z4P5_FONAL|nr:dihydrolipoyl dehydrogenase 1, mitochondrial [Fonticula alba]KCV69096.1 dihydrolipoyl dehydrogenase 1, mitochondrial [Fonticula alba]|eukprot:XP_009496667.1 dihydrolipoyl dehydrogenase 1, mitochondrial [Fonticula alba]